MSVVPRLPPGVKPHLTVLRAVFLKTFLNRSDELTRGVSMLHWSAPGARVRAAVAAIMFAGAFLDDARPAGAAATAVAVEWTHLVKATAVAGSVTKSGGCNGCNDAGATSAQTITTADGYAEFTGVAGRRVYAGLGTNATSNTDPALIQYAFSLWEDGGWDVRERNVYK